MRLPFALRQVGAGWAGIMYHWSHFDPDYRLHFYDLCPLTDDLQFGAMVFAKKPWNSSILKTRIPKMRHWSLIDRYIAGGVFPLKLVSPLF